MMTGLVPSRRGGLGSAGEAGEAGGSWDVTEGLGALGIEEACAPNNVGALVVLCQAQNNDATIIATTTIAAAAKSRQYCGGR